MLNKILAFVFASMFIAVVIAANSSDEQQSVDSFIVQGASLDTMNDQMTAAGGEVTHSFKVIEAVSAKLTAQQIANVKQANPLLRFFRNSDVDVSANTV